MLAVLPLSHSPPNKPAVLTEKGNLTALAVKKQGLFAFLERNHT